MSDPNFDALKAIHAEARTLEKSGKLTQETFDALMKRAEDAVGEHQEFLESLLMLGVEHGFVEL